VSKFTDFLKFMKSNGNQYVAQKYIENPLVIHKKKFDIRVWVLVTSWNPLTVWIFDAPYIRFGAEDYNTEDINNLFIHLTNNSIASKSNCFNDSVIEGNMWDTADFIKYLKNTYDKDVWGESLRERIYNLITWSLESSQDMIENRRNSHEIYGFDVMIDSDLNPWLIEINSSPCMDYSTKVTVKLVKLVAEDLVRTVLESSSLKQGTYSGLFYLAFLGEYVEESKQLGKNFLLTGKKLTGSDF